MVRRPNSFGREESVVGPCTHVVNERVEEEKVLVCKLTSHAHDRGCKSFCPSKNGEHLHCDDACFETHTYPVREYCRCTSFDRRTEEEVRSDDWRERRRCYSCGCDEKFHTGGETRHCRRRLDLGKDGQPIPGVPYGWRCTDCTGYVARSEFAREPHAYVRPGAWDPMLEADAAKRRAEHALIGTPSEGDHK